MAGTAFEQQLRLDRLQFRFDDFQREEFDADFVGDVVDFEPLVEITRGDAASFQSRFFGIADVTFEEQSRVLDEPHDRDFDAFDFDPEEQREARFLFEVEDFPFQRQLFADRGADEGFEFDQAGFGEGAAGPCVELRARAGGQRLGVGG